MKNYDCIFLACLVAVITLHCSCRSSYRSTHESSQVRSLDLHGESLTTTTGSVTSLLKTAGETNSNYYRISRTYDTSLPVDSQTGLHPLSSETIEGWQETSTVDQEEANTSHTNQEQEQSVALKEDESSTSGQETTHQGGVLSGLDRGISIGLAIGIPVLIILSVMYYVRKKDSSK